VSRWSTLSSVPRVFVTSAMKTLAISVRCYNSRSRFQVRAGALKSGSSNDIPDTRLLARLKKESANPTSTGSIGNRA
jgi:hypothetical protein